MASGKEIKTRINSVNNTAKITKAMQMISATKMRKAQDIALAAQPYSRGLYSIVKKIGKVPGYSHPLMRVSEQKNRALVLTISSQKGFVGGLNASLESSLRKFKEENSFDVLDGVGLHKFGIKVQLNAGVNTLYQFPQSFDPVVSTDLDSVFKTIKDGYFAGDYDVVYINYSELVNAALQRPVIKQLLPLSLDEIIQKAQEEVDSEASKDMVPYKFEPTPRAVLDFLIPEYFENQIITAILNSNASEHAARMLAMKNATDNANELSGALKLQYNKNRQAQITQQMLEVVGGSLKKKN